MGLMLAWNNPAGAEKFIVKNGKGNAEIIIAENPSVIIRQ
jgi:hypothetical protein